MGSPIFDMNGRKFSLTSATITVAAFTALGATEVGCTEKLEPGEVEGTSPVPIGYTTGKWSGTAKFRLPLAEALEFKRTLGSSFGTANVTGCWTFTELEGDGVESIMINGARITSCDLDAGDRQKGSSVAFELLLTQPSTWGGVRLVDVADPLAAAAGFALGMVGGALGF